MSNIAKKPKPALSKDQHRFIDDVAALFMHWGMPQTEARLNAYLMLCAAPVSLDRIAEDLQMAKSSASVAARALDAYRVVQKHHVRERKGVVVGKRGSVRVGPGGGRCIKKKKKQ